MAPSRHVLAWLNLTCQHLQSVFFHCFGAVNSEVRKRCAIEWPSIMPATPCFLALPRLRCFSDIEARTRKSWHTQLKYPVYVRILVSWDDAPWQRLSSLSLERSGVRTSRGSCPRAGVVKGEQPRAQ